MNIINATIDYLRSAKNELGKVTWPSKDQTVRYSVLVIGASLAVAIFFGVMDVGLSRLVTAALANKKSSAPAQEVPATVPNTIDIDDVQVQTKDQTQPAAVQPTVDFKNVEPIETPANEPKSDTQTPNF